MTATTWGEQSLAHYDALPPVEFIALDDDQITVLVAHGPDTTTALADEDGDGVDDAAQTPDAETPPISAEAPAPADRNPVDRELPPLEGGVRFRIPAAVLEGWATSDDREIAAGSLGHRALPQSLMVMTRNPDGGWGHAAAFVGGRVDVLERFDASAMINVDTGEVYGEGVQAWRAEGWLGNTTEEEQRTVELIRTGQLTGVSVDVLEALSEIVVLEEDEDGWPTRVRELVTQGQLAGMTVCPFPAFPGAYIELVDDDTQADPVVAAAALRAADGAQAAILASGVGVRVVDARTCAPCAADAPDNLVASGGPLAPPSAWFEDPQLPGPTAMTYEDNGRVYGHVATWGTCHTGVGDRCVTPPRSRSSYALFHTGVVRTAEGTDVPVGQITLGTGHASLSYGLNPAVEHYDNTGTAATDVRLYEDEHGIVAAGAVRPGLTDEEVRTLRAAAVSGDWRGHAGGLELIGVLSVNVPGFPVPRVEAQVAAGAPVSLVAAGARSVPRPTTLATQDVQAAVAAAVRPFLTVARRAQLDRIRARA